LTCEFFSFAEALSDLPKLCEAMSDTDHRCGWIQTLQSTAKPAPSEASIFDMEE
jgi:hypothetical protein